MAKIDKQGIYELGGPASIEMLSSLEADLGFELPNDYKALLLQANGLVLSSGIVLYSIEDLVERNLTFEVFDYAPGYLAIGDDSGGRALLIDYSTGSVYLIDQGTMDPDEKVLVNNSIPDWIKSGFVLNDN